MVLTRGLLSELIGAIYGCALEPARWQQTLAQVASAFACERAILSLNDLSTDRDLLSAAVGWDEYWLAERRKYLPEIHAVLDRWLHARNGDDEPFIASRALSPDQAGSSTCVREFLTPLGIVDVAHYFLIRDASHFSDVVLFRSSDRGAFDGAALGLGSLLLPHLRRAVTISKVLDARTIERNRMAEALDALQCGVMLIGDDGRLLHANRAAEHMLREGRLVRSSNGRLQAQRPSANHELHRAVHLSGQDAAAIDTTGLAIRLTEKGQSPVFAHVLPISTSGAASSIDRAATSAVFVNADHEGAPRLEPFATLYGLTCAEVRVLAGLLSGRSLADVARMLHVGRATVKTQLDSVFQKTGTHRQAELLNLIIKTIPPWHGYYP